jgi:hypothetical protein
VKEAVAIAHATRARVRLVAPVLRARRESCERVARAIADELNADRVVVRPVTGSVIVERANAPLDAREVARRLEELVAGEREAAGNGEMRARTAPGTGVARAIAVSLRALNNDVRETFDDGADLASLVPRALVAASAAQVVWSGNLPAVPWYSLVWYALRSFITFNADAIGESKPNATGD